MARGTARAPAAQRRGEILRAARACITERGYHETTIDDIAERCGLSKGAIYWHFPGKRELFLALVDDYVAELGQARRAALDAEDAPEAVRSVFASAVGDPESLVALVELGLEYLAHASRDLEVRERFRIMYDEVAKLAVEQIERGIRERSFRAVDPDTVVRSLFALGDGLLMQKVIFPDLDLQEAMRAGVDLVLGGLLIEAEKEAG